MKIAAIQLDADFANVKSNLIKSKEYIRDSVLAGAELVLLPEFFTSAIGFSDCMMDVAVQNRQVFKLLKQWAAEYRVIIGGSYIDFDGENAFNLFRLVFPNGESFEHRKDIPTQFENCYYTNGDDHNVFTTPIGNIGVALCWEMIRYDTLKRIAGKADFVLAGSCWWDLPIDAPLEREALRQYNQKLARLTPVVFAKLSGVPVVHASHCGKVTALRFPNANTMQTRRFVGATQIIDKNGHVIIRKDFSEGGGFVISDISWETTDDNNVERLSNQYWIPNLPDSYIRAWETINSQGKNYYEAVTLPYYRKCY